MNNSCSSLIIELLGALQKIEAFYKRSAPRVHSCTFTSRLLNQEYTWSHDTGTAAIFNISKSSIPRCTLSFPQKASRVCFTSAPKHSQGIRASKGDESFNKIKEGAGELKDNMEAKANEMAGKAADRAGEINDIAADQVGEMKQSAQETASMAADKSEEGWSKAGETATEAKDKTLDAAETVAEKTRQTVAGAWEAALETSEKIKETVVGSSDEVKKD